MYEIEVFYKNGEKMTIKSNAPPVVGSTYVSSVDTSGDWYYIGWSQLQMIHVKKIS